MVIHFLNILSLQRYIHNTGLREAAYPDISTELSVTPEPVGLEGNQFGLTGRFFLTADEPF